MKEEDKIVDEIRYIAASLVGAGIDRDALNEALQSNPHFIACDAGTTDAGPFSLGSGHPAFAREAVKGDLALLLDAGRRAGCPVYVGSGGVAGRCSDTAQYAAMPIMHGFPAGLAWHAGKVVECGTLACVTAGKGVMLVCLRHDDFIVRPFGQGLRCTPQSIAAHSFYENVDPFHFRECSGTVDITEATYEAIDAITVRVANSRFHPAEAYTVKLEGAELAGYQTIIIGGIRDPFLLRQLDSWLAKVRAYIEETIARVLDDRVTRDDYQIMFHVYGRDGVMGSLEPDRTEVPKEVGIVFEVTAPTQQLSTTIAELSRQPLLHYPIAEWSGATTSFACLHNPAHVERGAVYRSEEHTSELQSRSDLVCRLLLEKKKNEQGRKQVGLARQSCTLCCCGS